jgi:tellurite resistance protein
MSLTAPAELTEREGRALVRALRTLAAVDGLHPREVALIDGMFADFAAADGPIAPDELAAALPGADARLVYMKLAYLVAHADGAVSPKERELLGRHASALGLTGGDCLALELQVLEEMEARLRSA